MRRTLTQAMALVLALSACSGGEDQARTAVVGSDGEAAGSPETVPPSALEDWNLRLDPGSGAGDFQMVADSGGWHIRTGPAGITWHPADLVEQGDFTTRATFQELKPPPGHREAFGLMVGGRHLQAPDQQYTYFLVRGTGDYLIKRREGDQTRTLVDWTPSDAVRAATAGSEPENALEVRVQGDSVRFVANGKVVETLPTARVDPWGIAGLRVNHRLDLRVSGFQVGGGSE